MTSDKTPEIPLTLARDVLHVFGHLPGHHCGRFTPLLLEAIHAADYTNRNKLAMLFPAEVFSVDMMTNQEGGRERLTEIAGVRAVSAACPE